jgi:hypothetical protein
VADGRDETAAKAHALDRHLRACPQDPKASRTITPPEQADRAHPFGRGATKGYTDCAHRAMDAAQRRIPPRRATKRRFNRWAPPCRAPLNRTGRTMAASTLGTPLALSGATHQTAPIEHDATTDALVAELRAVIATQRLRWPATVAGPDAPTSEETFPAIETRRDWLARGFRFW